MRSRALRVTVGALAWIVIGAAAFRVGNLEQSLKNSRAALRTFDVRARETSDALADLRASQQAYVAAGQGLAFWLPRVATSIDTIHDRLAALTAAATGADTKVALTDAVSAMVAFAAADQHVREYLQNDQPLMASDVVFSDGREDSVMAASHVERARVAERVRQDASERDVRRLQALTAAGAGAFVALVVLLLVPRTRDRSTDTIAIEDSAETAAPTKVETPETSEAAGRQQAEALRGGGFPVLRAAAQLCTELGAVSTLDDLERLLSRAADMLDATGVVVWIGQASSTELRPGLAHGYGPEALARIPVIPRSANNAVAAAYRTASLQIVAAASDRVPGALVVPIVSPAGCIGVLSAEIRGGAESSDAVQALATILAAQLAGVITVPQEPGEKAAVG